MPNALKSCTIIPNELYVARRADRQLERIISGMGRPGYVLVARQMGKTNLLLNARRNADAESAYVYVDVSNRSPDLRTFFRGIVDLCIDTIPQLGVSVKERIDSLRRGSGNVLPHREHESELRVLLSEIPGKLVFFLDEIDALTRVDYSDRVFSFIRSVYFSGRTNFPEFSRLTYVLSGVAEPSEIIKDRSISPFNIGEKIYLEDFSRLEFNEFAGRAGLTCNAEILDRVFYWSGGNPRITWDIFAEVESSAEIRSSEDVDRIVEELYLRAFDLPPVDHIRNLVVADKEIRGAIMSIHYAKTEAISDSTKSRMYLAGIISSNSFDGAVEIKNRVIEAALSEKWLSEVERDDVPLEEHAIKLFNAGRYHEAYATFVEMDSLGVAATDVEMGAYLRAQCLYIFGRHEEGIEVLKKNPYPKSRSVDIYIRSFALLGSMQQSIGELPESISSLERAIKEYGVPEGSWPLDYCGYQLNLAFSCIRDKSIGLDYTTGICRQVLDNMVSRGDVSDSGAAAEQWQQLVSLSYYILHQAAMRSGDLVAADEHFRDAISHAGRSDKASLMVIRAHLQGDVPDRDAWNDCVEYCIDNRVPITSDRAARVLSFHASRAVALIYELAKQVGNEDLLLRFLEYCSDVSVDHEVDFVSLVNQATGLAWRDNRTSKASPKILQTAISLLDGPLNDRWAALLASYLAVCDEDVFPHMMERYKEILSLRQDAFITYIGHRMAWHYFSIAMLEQAHYVLSLNEPESEWDSVEDAVTMGLLAVVKAKMKLVVHSNEVIHDLYERVSKSVVAEGGVYDDAMRVGMLTMLVREFSSELKPVAVQRVGLKYGRNDIVEIRRIDGSTVIGKYKKFSSDVLSGQAQVIRSVF